MGRRPEAEYEGLALPDNEALSEPQTRVPVACRTCINSYSSCNGDTCGGLHHRHAGGSRYKIERCKPTLVGWLFSPPEQVFKLRQLSYYCFWRQFYIYMLHQSKYAVSYSMTN